MTASAALLRAAGQQAGKLGAEAAALLQKYPPRPTPAAWAATGQDRA
jgi:hypothetical protein